MSLKVGKKEKLQTETKLNNSLAGKLSSCISSVTSFCFLWMASWFSNTANNLLKMRKSEIYLKLTSKKNENPTSLFNKSVSLFEKQISFMIGSEGIKGLVTSMEEKPEGKYAQSEEYKKMKKLEHKFQESFLNLVDSSLECAHSFFLSFKSVCIEKKPSYYAEQRRSFRKIFYKADASVIDWDDYVQLQRTKNT